uniref:Glycosyltransferase family 92 protein n=1 Tax=Tetraselmis sp. GSL018 TaxID=582737 RepID=A0A061SC83_9CHLO|mmetsp:Transcript_18193/g.43566  ORF Transcript_18193/g.43566 Transcript_18193/m.43566 type:complete len:414 (-) Transcript_18193:177-1418(-)
MYLVLRTAAKPLFCQVKLILFAGWFFPILSCISFKQTSNAVSSFAPNLSVAIYTRFSLEGPYLDFWIRHYQRLGFNHIVALQDGPVIGLEDLVQRYGRSYLDIHQVPRSSSGKRTMGPHHFLGAYQNLVLSKGFDWVFAVDADEFLVLPSRLKSIQQFVSAIELEQGRIDAVQFRWAVIHDLKPFCSEQTFPEYLHTVSVYPNRHVKTMVRTAMLDKGYKSFLPVEHTPHMKSNSRVYFEGTVLSSRAMRALYRLSYNHSYQGAFLVHMQTRSLSSLIAGAYFNAGIGKSIASAASLVDLLRGSSPRLWNQFQSCIGLKARLISEEVGCRLRDDSTKSCSPAAPIRLLLPNIHHAYTLPPLPICNRTLERLQNRALLQRLGVSEGDLEASMNSVSLDFVRQQRHCCPHVPIPF